MNFIERGQKIGATVEAKSKQYAGTTEVAAGMMLCLFPEGIPTEKMGSALLLVRICDKMGRIAQGDGTGDEDAWGDIAGYGLIGQKHNEDEIAAEEVNDDFADALAYAMPMFKGCIINPEAVNKLDKIINETTEELLKTFEAMGNRATTISNEPVKKGVMLGAWCGNCKNHDLCLAGEESGNNPFPECKGVYEPNAGEPLPVGSPLANWEPIEGTLSEVAPEPASGNKAPVCLGCTNCKFNVFNAAADPCKKCLGWFTGEKKPPAWEPKNG